jgi:hypothetical protein
MKPLYAIAPLALVLAFFGPTPNLTPTISELPQAIWQWLADDTPNTPTPGR